MLYMITATIPESMNESRHKIGKSEITFLNVIEYAVLSAIVILSVFIYHFETEHKLFKYVLLADLICFIIGVISHRNILQKNTITDIVISEGMWVIWLVYGFIFNDLEDYFSDTSEIIISLLSIGLVLLTYFQKIQTNEIYMLFVLSMMLILFGFPHKYSNFYMLSSENAFMKAITFVVITIFTNIGNIKDISEGCLIQIKITRILWILCVHNFFLIFSLIVLLPFISKIFKNTKKKEISENTLNNKDLELKSKEKEIEIVIDKPNKEKRRNKKIDNKLSDKEITSQSKTTVDTEKEKKEKKEKKPIKINPDVIRKLLSKENGTTRNGST